MLKSFAKTHIGQRKNNEDTILIDIEMGLYIVADGVGGLNKGDVASQLACKIVHKNILAGKTLKDSIYIAHRNIVEQIKADKEKQGMATTIAAVLFNENSYEMAWVGDSRIYLWNEKLQLLTRDDSYVELLLENGHITVDELETHPDRNVISQALGIERKQIRIHSNFGVLTKNQKLLVCSDGLYTIAKESDIIQCCLNNSKAETITEKLVKSAVEKEGKDNISLITVSADNFDTKNEMAQKPVVFREFHTKTGQSIQSPLIRSFKKNSQEEESDPELIDQTTFTDLSPEDREKLDYESETNNSEQNTSNYLVPFILACIVALLGWFLFNNS